MRKIYWCLVLLILVENNCSAQEDHFYQKKEFKRNLNDGLWLGIGGSLMIMKQSVTLPVFPIISARLEEGTGHYFANYNFSPIIYVRAPIQYKSIYETSYHSSQYKYQAAFENIEMGYYIKNVYIKKSVVGVAICAGVSILDFNDVDLATIKNFSNSLKNQPIVVQTYSASAPLNLGIQIDRFFWLRNKQLSASIKCMYSILQIVPANSTNEDSKEILSFFINYNINTKIRFNPLKMYIL